MSRDKLQQLVQAAQRELAETSIELEKKLKHAEAYGWSPTDPLVEPPKVGVLDSSGVSMSFNAMLKDFQDMLGAGPTDKSGTVYYCYSSTQHKKDARPYRPETWRCRPRSLPPVTRVAVHGEISDAPIPYG